MAGDYVASFGERMKDFKRKPHRGPVQRAPLWIRFRYSWTAGGPRKQKKGQWIYAYWENNLSEISRFTGSVLGSYKQTERLTRERPTNIGDTPFERRNGVDLFMERM